MRQQLFRNFVLTNGTPDQCRQIAIEKGRMACARANQADQVSSERCREEAEAEYSRLRADAEFRCAEQARHPAAREAHLRLADLYRQRQILAEQASADEIQDWEGEGGGLLPEW
jgi:hypothetical protein